MISKLLRGSGDDGKLLETRMRSIHFWRESGVEAEAESDPSYLSSLKGPSIHPVLPSHLSFGGLLDLPLFLDDLEDLLLSRERERLLRRRGGDLDLRRGGEAGYERKKVRCSIERAELSMADREVKSEFG